MSLYSNEIYEILKKDDYASAVFKDVLPRNHLPHKLSYPSAYIINNKKDNHEGEHWIAFFFDKNKNCDFFDSFGKGPSAYGLTKYLCKYSKCLNFNRVAVQSNYSFYCGYHAIYFILLRSRNIPLDVILNNFYDKKNLNLNYYRISFIK